MKQPIITRDLERKAIYTDIVLRDDRIYISTMGSGEYTYEFNPFVDWSGCVFLWGDGAIDKTPYHTFSASSQPLEIEIRGKVSFHGCIFDRKHTVAALSSGKNLLNIDHLFDGCENLEYISPSFFLYTHKEDQEDLSYAFRNCKSLWGIPEDLFDGFDKARFFKSTFEGCESLGSIPADLFKPTISAEDFSRTFAGCKGLKSVPEDLFSKCEKARLFDETFAHCSRLEHIPEQMFPSGVHMKPSDLTLSR